MAHNAKLYKMRDLEFITWHNGKMITEVIGSEHGTITGVSRSDIVLQFTGFYCNNTKVYDGCILKHPKSTEPEEKGWIVVWKDFGWKLKCVNLVNGEELFTELSDYFANECEIIGNIYENPELLA